MATYFWVNIGSCNDLKLLPHFPEGWWRIILHSCHLCRCKVIHNNVPALLGSLTPMENGCNFNALQVNATFSWLKMTKFGILLHSAIRNRFFKFDTKPLPYRVIFSNEQIHCKMFTWQLFNALFIFVFIYTQWTGSSFVEILHEWPADVKFFYGK